VCGEGNIERNLSENYLLVIRVWEKHYREELILVVTVFVVWVCEGNIERNLY
jgi:hypothetical protein